MDMLLRVRNRTNHVRQALPIGELPSWEESSGSEKALNKLGKARWMALGDCRKCPLKHASVSFLDPSYGMLLCFCLKDYTILPNAGRTHKGRWHWLLPGRGSAHFENHVYIW